MHVLNLHSDQQRPNNDTLRRFRAVRGEVEGTTVSLFGIEPLIKSFRSSTTWPPSFVRNTG